MCNYFPSGGVNILASIDYMVNSQLQRETQLVELLKRNLFVAFQNLLKYKILKITQNIALKLETALFPI